MKINTLGMTIIETLIGITFLAVVIGSILGIFMVVQRYFKDNIAMVNSQAVARISIEKMVRPDIREGAKFTVSDGGNTLTIDEYDSTTDVFTFENGDGDDATFEDNKIKKNEKTIGTNIVKIPGAPIFQELKENELVGINFGVKHEGLVGHYKEIHISTVIKLRN